MNQKNEDAQAIAAECIRQSEEGSYERGLFRRAGKLIRQLLAELEAVGAGGMQPLREEAGWALVPTMDDAVAAGDGVLMQEQAALLRECRLALDELLRKKPMMAGLICGSTTLGNLRASLYGYRPQGVLGREGAAPQQAAPLQKGGEA